MTGATLAAVERSPVTVVIGASDTGKTTLIARLATHLFIRGHRVAVVDADVGQSELGPPTTIALGRVRRPLDRLADAEVEALYFAGATSPGRCLAAVVAGARVMTERGRAIADRVLVDTSGLVTGGLGLALKGAKLDALAPDLVVCLERHAECEPILARYTGRDEPVVLHSRPSSDARPRSVAARRAHRQRALERHFARARPVAVDLAWTRDVPGPHDDGTESLDEVLVGVEDTTGETLGLGRIVGIDRSARTLTIETAVEPARVARIRIGSSKYPG